MADKTSIEWTDATWNPIRGCSRVSAGCDHCYAQGVANRFSGPGQAYEGLVHLARNDGRALGWNGSIHFIEEHLLDPIRWKRPRRIFVNSMSDLFHENVTDDMRDRIFAVMALAPQHTFQILTKRPERMLRYMQGFEEDGVFHEGFRSALIEGMAQHLYSKHIDTEDRDVSMWLAVHLPLKNVLLGVSVENQLAADERIPLLLQTPAAIRFLSCEPLLGPVDLTALYGGIHIRTGPSEGDIHADVCLDALSGKYEAAWHGRQQPTSFRAFTTNRVDWVIAGGESGRSARPMHPDWARSLRDQCSAAGVSFFFKQWGEWAPQTDGRAQLEALSPTTPVTLLAADGARGQCLAEVKDHPRFGRMLRVGKQLAGDMLDGVQHHAFPEVG